MDERYMKKCSCNSNYNKIKENAVRENICDNINQFDIEYKSKSNKCQCGFYEEENIFPSNPMLGQSYVPTQKLNRTFIPCCGLKHGTIFPELVSPYYPCQSIRDNEYLKRRNNIGKGCNKF